MEKEHDKIGNIEVENNDLLENVFEKNSQKKKNLIIIFKHNFLKFLKKKICLKTLNTFNLFQCFQIFLKNNF